MFDSYSLDQSMLKKCIWQLMVEATEAPARESLRRPLHSAATALAGLRREMSSAQEPKKKESLAERARSELIPQCASELSDLVHGDLKGVRVATCSKLFYELAQHDVEDGQLLNDLSVVASRLPSKFFRGRDASTILASSSKLGLLYEPLLRKLRGLVPNVAEEMSPAECCRTLASLATFSCVSSFAFTTVMRRLASERFLHHVSTADLIGAVEALRDAKARNHALIAALCQVVVNRANKDAATAHDLHRLWLATTLMRINLPWLHAAMISSAHRGDGIIEMVPAPDGHDGEADQSGEYFV